MEVQGVPIGVDHTEKHYKVSVVTTVGTNDDNIDHILEIVDDIADESGIRLTNTREVGTKLLPLKPTSKVSKFFVNLCLNLFLEFPGAFVVYNDDDEEDRNFMNLLRNAASSPGATAAARAERQAANVSISDRIEQLNRQIREITNGPTGILGHHAANTLHKQNRVNESIAARRENNLAKLAPLQAELARLVAEQQRGGGKKQQRKGALESYTVAELKTKAANRGVSLKGLTKKADIIAKLR